MKATILWVLLLLGSYVDAAPRIAVLNFELDDITSLPNTPAEQKRTAGIGPLLAQALRQTGEFDIVSIDPGVQAGANAGFGYLFRFSDLAAEMGRQAGVDWVVVGQHGKPSFLFSYLRAHLVDVKNRESRAAFDIELKGTHAKVMQRGVETLADKIRLSLQRQRTP